MKPWEQFGIRCRELAGPPPSPANDNRHLLPDDMTAAEVMQWVKQERRRLSRELDADHRLWNCSEHRLTWDITLAIEQMLRRQCYGLFD